MAIASVLVSSKDTSIFFLSTSQMALATPSTLFAAFSMVFLHMPQLPLTPKDSSDITVAFETSVAVVSNSFLELFLQLITPNAAMTATLKITFLIFLILKFILVFNLFYNLFYFTTSKHCFAKIRIDYLFLFA